MKTRNPRRPAKQRLFLGCCTLTVALAAACSPAATGGCETAPDALVSHLRHTARTDFAAGDSTIDHTKIAGTSLIELPADDRAFGATKILAVRTVQYFANPVSSDLGGVYISLLFATDGSAKRLLPLDQDAADTYGLDMPATPAWKSWSDRMNNSPVAEKAYGCVAADHL